MPSHVPPTPSELPHNRANAVTQSIQKLTLADGPVVVRKRLGRTKSGAPPHGQASDEPRHWNYWRREAEVYASQAVAASLAGTGLRLPAADVTPVDGGVDLLLEHVAGRPGTRFELDDHVTLAVGLGRWQARPPLELPWTSHGFLRAYSESKPAPDIVDDDVAWAHPLVAGCFPPGLRAGWKRLLGNRERLLSVMETLPRVSAHLDVWPANVIRCDDGEVVLVDWSFFGDGAIGEDLGNHVPDSVFDLFWPSERLDELEAATLAGYVNGLRDGGWRGDERLVRLGMLASCVKYTWLLPVMLAVADRDQHHAYSRLVSADQLYTERGRTLARLVSWCDEALDLADRLGR